MQEVMTVFGKCPKWEKVDHMSAQFRFPKNVSFCSSSALETDTSEISHVRSPLRRPGYIQKCIFLSASENSENSNIQDFKVM